MHKTLEPTPRELVDSRLALYERITANLIFRPTEINIYRDALSVLARVPADPYDDVNGRRIVGPMKHLISIAESASRATDDIEVKSALYDVRRDAYTIIAPFDFDSFMIAMEWDRDPKARFWLPRRRALEGKHMIASQLQEFMYDDSKFLSFSQSPGTGKSTLIKFLMAFIAGKEPDSMNLYVSYGSAMVNMMLTAVHDMIMGDEYRFSAIFPCMNAPEVSREYGTISYRRKGDFSTLSYISLNASLTGRSRANRFMIVDDLVKNDEEARSPERLNKLWLDFTSTVTTRTIGESVKILMLGTMWSLHDPINRMLREHEGDPKYKFIAIPVWNEQTEVSNYEYECEDSYTTEAIRTIRGNLEPYAFSALYLCRPMEKEGLAFKRDELFRFNGILPDCEPDKKTFVIDVAWGGGDSLSMPIAYVFGDECYIVDWLFDKSDKSVTEPRVVGKIISHQLRTGTVEANNGGEGYKDDLNRMLKEKNYRCNIKSKKAPGNMAKLEKIEQHAPTIRRFFFLDDDKQSDEYRAAFNEFTSFSFIAKNLHDDAADSLAQLSDALTEGIKVPTVSKRIF